MEYPTSRAMQIAGVNRLRFNEAVAAGHYKCAPTTEYRKSRTFDYADMIGLSVFGRLLHADLSYRVAAEIACVVVDNVRSHGDDLQSVVVGWKPNGERWSGPWFGPGNDQGRACLDPASAEWANLFQFNIATIAADIVSRSSEIGHQAD